MVACQNYISIPAYRPRNYSNLEGLLPAHDDCIRVLYPNQANQINLPGFVNPDDEVVEDPVDDLEAQIIESYQLVLEEESEPEGERPPPPRISYTAALEALETLTLFKLQAGTMASTQQQSFWRERRRIEGAQTAEKGRQRQRTLEECIGVSACIYFHQNTHVSIYSL